MKNDVIGFRQISFFGGFIARRFLNAFVISAVSFCFVLIHYSMKDHWTEKLISGGRVKGEKWPRQSIGTIKQQAIFEPPVQRRNSLQGSTNNNFHNATELMRRRNEADLLVAISNEKSYERNAPQHLTQTSAMPTENIWLNDFTPGLSQNLAILLQNIVTRDFEKTNETPHRNRRGMRCNKGYFRLRGMTSCREWLGCAEINSMNRGSTFGIGVGKIIQVSRWNSKDVVISSLRQDRMKYRMFVKRVESGVRHMLLVQPSPFATQVVGVCDRGNNTILVLENCKKGDFLHFVSSPDYRRLSTMEKLSFAIQMIASFDYLHHGLDLPRVHCDLHTVLQAFGQWVVSEDNRLFLSDLDELPVVDKKKKIYATCEREPFGKMEQAIFLAPEARYSHIDFDEDLPLKPVDQYSDVWKLPDLFANIMLISSEYRRFETFDKLSKKFYFEDELREIHIRCKNIDASKRPSSREVLTEYLKLYERNL